MLYASYDFQAQPRHVSVGTVMLVGSTFPTVENLGGTAFHSSATTPCIHTSAQQMQHGVSAAVLLVFLVSALPLSPHCLIRIEQPIHTIYPEETWQQVECKRLQLDEIFETGI